MSIDDDDPYIKPLEWLTSPQSLKPYIIEALQSTNNNINDNDWNHSSKKSVLHVGCGSSILGEQLLIDTDYNVHYVLNIDNDIHTIERMKLRWDNNNMQHQKMSSSLSDLTANHNNNNNNDAKILDFQIIEFRDSSTRINADDYSFDMVIDKSTMDCLLCSRTDVIASLINETYRLLKPNTGIYFIISFHSIDILLPLLQNIPNIHWDVTYTIIKRDHTECFNNDNNSHNDVHNNEIDSTTTTTTKIAATSIHNDNNKNNTNKTTSNNNNNNEDYDKFRTLKIIQCRKRPQQCCDHQSVNDRNYTKTTTTISTTVCCSSSTINSSMRDNNDDDNNNNKNPSTSSLDDNINHWKLLCQHIHEATYNVFLTNERIEEIHQSFLHHEIESIIPANTVTGSTSNSSSTTAKTCVDDSSCNMNHNNSSMTKKKLSLYESYIILFNDIEREYYLYEDDFLVDWYEFCKMKKQQQQKHDGSFFEQNEELLLQLIFDETTMTVEIAIEFLKVMQ